MRRHYIPISVPVLALLLSGIPWIFAAANDQSEPPVTAQRSCKAPDTESEYVSLEQLIEETLAANPELRAARYRWEAMKKRPGQESALPDPTIRIGWASARAPYPGAGLGSEPSANLGVEVTQMIPFPGKRQLRGSMAQQEARVESFMFQGTELSLISRLKSAFYQLQYAYDAIDVLHRNKDLLQRLGKLAENRYAVGQATQQDIIKSQIELDLLDARLLEFERIKQSMIAEINTLRNREIGALLNRPEPLAVMPELPALESMQTAAMDSSPTLRAQRASIDSRQAGLELSRRDYYPDFEVMGGYFNQGAMKDMWEFRVQINVPIFFARKQRLGVEEAGARLREAQNTFKAGEQIVRNRIKDRHLAADNSRRLMDLYSRRIMPQASLALESSLNSYSTGALDFLSVYSNFSIILENELKYCESRAQFLRALANLEELTGK